VRVAAGSASWWLPVVRSWGWSWSWWRNGERRHSEGNRRTKIQEESGRRCIDFQEQNLWPLGEGIGTKGLCGTRSSVKQWGRLELVSTAANECLFHCTCIMHQATYHSAFSHSLFKEPGAKRHRGVGLCFCVHGTDVFSPPLSTLCCAW